MCPAQRRHAWLAQSADVRGWKGVTFNMRDAEGPRTRSGGWMRRRTPRRRPKTNRAGEMAASDQLAVLPPSGDCIKVLSGSARSAPRVEPDAGVADSIDRVA